jgi:hypothetical protein
MCDFQKINLVRVAILKQRELINELRVDRFFGHISATQYDFAHYKCIRLIRQYKQLLLDARLNSFDCAYCRVYHLLI